ncbi:IclR family transcriptional regulator [Streptomyces winkii]|uniref:IclR family transcriptional regulator n=1 Tax=Streptomyces winkii TaxID=3051178 RepID=UPI0028D5C7BD|nr:helix-turn-helix domain-containing protein [Streptomyces sp. DSM 40971]
MQMHTPRTAVGRSRPVCAEEETGTGPAVLGHGLRLLNSFQPGENWVPLPEIARRTSLPKPTVKRLAGELARAGMVERGPQGLRLGAQLYVLGLRAPGPRNLRSISRPVLDRLQSATGASVYLCVLDGSEVVQIDTVRGPTRTPNASTVRERRAVCTAAVTKVLSKSAPSPVDAAVSGAAAGDTGGLSPCRECGPDGSPFAPDDGGEERTDDVVVLTSRQMRGVCAPVVQPDGRVLAALTAVGPVHGTLQPPTVQQVQQAAREIGRQAGQAEASHQNRG